ncbi:MAG TPA: hypothetical protein VHM26_02645 [Chitinophagaceae bacterium]|nr:hypothetical protein [Chitinophagaceae bacterium]
MPKKNLWITLCIANLVIVALLGVILRAKQLFPIPFIDYKNLLSGHSHFAFGGWVTLALMILLIDKLLTPQQQRRKYYQYILMAVQVSSCGMLLAFPLQGYAMFSMIFSTGFILVTYLFAWFFIRDLRERKIGKPVFLLALVAMISLAVSSVGPFSLAYMMASKTGNALLFRDSIYTYLHFQYNGFFTLSVFALFLGAKEAVVLKRARRLANRFAILLSISVFPSLFISLLWHESVYFKILATVGVIFIGLTLITFLHMMISNKRLSPYDKPARILIILSLIAFVLKMALQATTIVPSLGQAVFGFRPIIIGFLHLVFLAFVSFYIIAEFVEDGSIRFEFTISRFAILAFAAAVIFNEAVLLVNGIGLLLQKTDPVFGWLLFYAAMGLFCGAGLLLAAKFRSSIALTKTKGMRLAV